MTDYGFEVKTMKVLTNDFIASNGKHFYIVSFNVNTKYLKGRQYGAISHDDVDENRKLTKRLNGFELHMKNTVAEVIKDIEYWVDVDRIMEALGVEKMVAVMMKNGMSREDAEKMNAELKKLHGAA